MNKMVIIGIGYSLFLTLFGTASSQPDLADNQNDTELYPKDWPNIHANVFTDFNSNVTLPEIQQEAFIHPFGVVIGNCYLGKMVFVAPTAVCRGDEGTPIRIGDFSNIQDGVILHGLETSQNGKFMDNRRFNIHGDRLLANNSEYKDGFSVFIGERTSLAHDSLVHGPAWVGNDTFVGMKSLIFNAKVGNNVAVGVSSTITSEVEIPDNKFVPPGSVISSQDKADELPERFGTPYENINKAVIDVNEQFAKNYQEKDFEKFVNQREKQMEGIMIESSMPDGKLNK